MSKLCLGLATAFFLIAISFSGCCAPLGSIGPGCATGGCNDCSGCGAGTQYIANGPLDALRNARRQLTCGAGCGETYQGEWISTPPDSHDPCCGNQFVGGATKCRPFCAQPGFLFRGIYGRRNCSGAASSTPCGCGGGCGGEIISSNIISAPSGGCSSGGCSSGGCAGGSCFANAQPVHSTTTQIVTNKPAVDRATTASQQAAVQQNKASVQQSTQQRVVR